MIRSHLRLTIQHSENYKLGSERRSKYHLILGVVFFPLSKGGNDLVLSSDLFLGEIAFEAKVFTVWHVVQKGTPAILFANDSIIWPIIMQNYAKCLRVTWHMNWIFELPPLNYRQINVTYQRFYTKIHNLL